MSWGLDHSFSPAGPLMNPNFKHVNRGETLSIWDTAFKIKFEKTLMVSLPWICMTECQLDRKWLS